MLKAGGGTGGSGVGVVGVSGAAEKAWGRCWEGVVAMGVAMGVAW